MAIVTIGGIPVYDALILDDESGMLKISLVDDPAVMSNFQAFDAQKKLLMYEVADEEKRLVRGVVMRADFPIFRRDKDMGEYYIIYKADTIRQMAEKYLVENRQNNINLMHEADSDVDGVQMVQFFIKDTAAGINPEGFDVADGSLFGEFHITNDEVWDQIKNGTYKGFSLEGIFDLSPEQDVDEIQEIVDTLEGKFKRIFKNTSNSKIMSKLSKLKAAIVKAFAEFGNITTDKGILAWDGDDDLNAGDSVYIEDAEGNRTPAEDGDYTTEDGKVIKVVDGKVESISDNSAEVAPTEAALKRQSFLKKIKEAFEESYEEKERRILDAINASLAEGSWAYIQEAGDNYAIVIVVDESWNETILKYEISWDESGNVILGASEEMKPAFVPVDDPNPADPAPSEEEMNRLKAENASLKAEVAKLKKTPAAKPAHEEVKTSQEFKKTGVKGLDNLARVLSAK